MSKPDAIQRIAESHGWNPAKQSLAEFIEARLSSRRAIRAAARELVLCDALAYLDPYYLNPKLRDRHDQAVRSLRADACGEADLYRAARRVDPETLDRAAKAWKARKDQQK